MALAFTWKDVGKLFRWRGRGGSCHSSRTAFGKQKAVQVHWGNSATHGEFT